MINCLPSIGTRGEKEITERELGRTTVKTIAMDLWIVAGLYFLLLALSLLNRSTANLSNKHDTRKMYFENKGIGQVLLGAPEEEPDGIRSEAREGFPGGQKDGSGFAKDANSGGGFPGREWPGQGHNRLQGQWQGAECGDRLQNRDRPDHKWPLE